MSKRRCWSESFGERGCTVRVCERTPGGVLYVATFDPTARHGGGGYRRRTLGHRDRRAARREARQLLAALEAGTPSTLVM